MDASHATGKKGCNRATEAGKAAGRGDISEIAGPGDRRQTYLATSGDSRWKNRNK
jgi:hypothetical protein